MKHLRKSILTLLALTLFGGAGAWAQGPTQVTQITADMIASWQGVNEYITLADLQDLGFEATDLATAQAWTGAPQSGTCYLFYAISGSNIAYVYFTAGSVNDHDNGSLVKSDLYYDVENGYKYFYTGAPSSAIELTKKGANQWTLGQTPDYDLELQVEYYQKYALKEIPAGWTVKVNGQDSTSSIVGGSLLITETDTVTLIPPAELKNAIKSVTLADEGPATQTITVTWNNNDITGSGNSFTKDGVTITAGSIDFNAKNFMQDGTFTTTLGNFTKIEVTAMIFDQFSGTGWSGSNTKQTWTGNASSVSFSGNINGMMMLPMGNINFVFTIESTN